MPQRHKQMSARATRNWSVQRRGEVQPKLFFGALLGCVHGWLFGMPSFDGTCLDKGSSLSILLCLFFWHFCVHIGLSEADLKIIRYRILWTSFIDLATNLISGKQKTTLPRHCAIQPSVHIKLWFRSTVVYCDIQSVLALCAEFTPGTFR